MSLFINVHSVYQNEYDIINISLTIFHFIFIYMFLSTLDGYSSSSRVTVMDDERRRDAEEQAVLVGATMGKGMESVCTLNVAKAKIK